MKFSEEKSPSKDETSPIQCYKFGHFFLDFTQRRLSLNGQIVSLTSRLFDILWILVSNHGEVVTKEELMKRIWQDQFVEDNNLTVSISAIRKALGVKYGDHKYIETVSKSGYRFTAQVTEVRDVSNTENQYKNELDKHNKSNNIIQTLAVLPFTSETAAPEFDYLLDGLSESIINNLSEVLEFPVLARSVINRYREMNWDLKRIGQEANVGIFVKGRIFQLKNDLSISIELIDSQNDFLISEMTYTFTLSQLLSLQKTIAIEISKRLSFTQKHSGKNRLAKHQTRNSEAYRLYIKGRYFMAKRNIKTLERAIDCFERAIAADATYSLAFSGLADCYSMLAVFGAYSPNEVVPKAKAAVLRSLEIDDTLAEAHASLAKIKVNFDWDWSGAEKEYLRAIELNPDYAHAYEWYAGHMSRVGLFDKAIEMIDIALEIDPLSLAINKTKAMILYLARCYDEALEHCFEALEVDPDYGPTNGLLGYIYADQQRYEEAILRLQKLISFAKGNYEISDDRKQSSPRLSLEKVVFSESDPEAIGSLGYIYAKAQKRDVARQLLRGLHELSEYRYIEPHTLATIYIGLKEYDSAFEWLERAFADRSHALTYLKIWSWFDSLRDDPRFIDLCARVGFAREYKSPLT